MIDFALSPENMPFTIAIAMMLGITVLEAMDLFIGAGISDLLESMLPDMDMDLDLEGDLVSGESSGFVKALGWLRFGEVPMLVLILFLTAFGLMGLGVQYLSKIMTGTLMHGMVVSIPVFLVSLPAVRLLGGIAAKIIPKDETDAVSERSFIGRTATIVLGTARAGSPAQAKLTDKNGTVHYVMVEPDVTGGQFETGDSVLLVSQEKAVFIGICDKM